MNDLGQVIGILEPENRKGQGVLTLFGEAQGYMPSTRKSIPSCMTVHNVAIAVIVSEILPFVSYLNVCQCHKSRSRSSDVMVGITPVPYLLSYQI